MNYSKENANHILKSIIGSNELVDAWWKSPNYFFNFETPESIWESNAKAVYDYLEMHVSK
jgi:hypothetical protein